MGEVWQLLLSLGAIAALVFLVRALRLGSDPAFVDEDDVRRAASHAADDFEPADIALDKSGAAALLADRHGRVLVLRAHGAHTAGRILDSMARARVEGGTLVIDPGDPRFGPVRLDIPDAERWKTRVDRL